jgi:hypothetical protein
VPDYWADQYDIESTSADSDGDGLQNNLEYLYGTDPDNGDTDNDGVSDNDEVIGGSDPTNPNETPGSGQSQDQEVPAVFIVDGDGGPAGQILDDTASLKVPQGTGMLPLRVVVFSREWPTYTGDQSEFNDQVTYNIEIPGDQTYSDSFTVNSLHSVFEEGEYPGGNRVVLEEMIDFTEIAETADVEVSVYGSAKNISDAALGSGVAIELGVLKMKTETIATTPHNRLRRIIGIGEEVQCSTIPTLVADWQVLPETAGSVFPFNGFSTKLTASKTPGSLTVRATLVDGNTIDIDFQVIEPYGIRFEPDIADVPPYPGIPGPPDTWIGNGRQFPFTFLPDTVSFYNILFRENIPAASWEWPDGEQGAVHAHIEGPLSVGYDNSWVDRSSAGFDSYERLDTFFGYVDYSYSYGVPWEYEGEGGSWIEFMSVSDNIHARSYKSSGACAVKVEADTMQKSTYRGPWRGWY